MLPRTSLYGIRTLPKRLIYFSDSASAHNLRFISLLEQDFSVTTAYLDQTTAEEIFEEIDKDTFNYLVYSPISLDIIEFLQKTDLKKIGICLAYEFNELSKEVNIRERIAVNLENTETLICDSGYIAEGIKKLYGYDKTSIVARYGCDLEIFVTPPEIEPKKLRILVTRNWTTIHGNELILQALKELDNRGIEFVASFVKWNSVSELDYSIPNFKYGQLNLLEYLKSEELRSRLEENWLYISAATSDGSSVSMLEALANGNIVLVSDFITNLEIIEDGENGFVFENKSAVSLVSKILQIMEYEPDRLRQVSVEARKTAQKMGNWKHESRMILNGIHSELETEG